jgi:hypothetical protein
MVVLCFVLAPLLDSTAQEPTPLPEGALNNATLRFHSEIERRYLKPLVVNKNAVASTDAATAPSAIPGIDSIVNFGGSFQAAGFDANDRPKDSWQFAMVGKNPRRGGTTTINAPIVPVSIDLLDANGQVAVFNGHKLHADVTPFIKPVLLSPLFQNATYSSSDVPTQLTDAEQRAEFFNVMAPNWHTLLAPSVKSMRTIQVPFGLYEFAVNKNGTCCAVVLIDGNTFAQLLFPPTPTDTTTLLGSAESSGDITTQELAMFLLPNAFLFDASSGACCVLGFHSIDVKPPDPTTNLQKVYAFAYTAWISPNTFKGNVFEDITAMSHEVAETFNDPFVVADGVHNLTPWWDFGFNCQDDMEVGDVIEGLSDRVTFPIKMNGRTYHPQNIALLQWFEFQSPSTAIGGAYSYPDPLTLTQLSFVEHANCQ